MKRKLVSDVEPIDIQKGILLLENLQETRFFRNSSITDGMLEALLELKQAVKELSFDQDIEEYEALQIILYDKDSMTEVWGLIKMEKKVRNFLKSKKEIKYTNKIMTTFDNIYRGLREEGLDDLEAMQALQSIVYGAQLNYDIQVDLNIII